MQSMRYAILMTVICPSMSSPVALQLDGVNEFVSSVTERISTIGWVNAKMISES